MRYARGCLFVFVFILAAGRTAATQVTRRSPSAPTVRVVNVAPDVKLEVLDWGGRGRPVVFLAGSGNTPHIFDDFAPQFTDRFHVVGITRRGYGGSAGLLPPNNLDTLVSDIRSVLDSLAFQSVVIIGHSFAGEEMTRFAELNPGRCAGLIYLDAAYDRTTIPTILKATPQPPPPPMRATDSASVDALRAYIVRVAGAEVPKSEILATSRFDARGRFVGNVTADSLEGQLWEAIRPPRYDRVACRSLGIYAVPDLPVDLMHYYPELDSTGRAQGDALMNPVKEVVAKSESLFRQSGRNEVLELHHSNHNVFLDRPADVARAIRRFLSSSH